MTALLQVKDWSRCFESNRTRGRTIQERCMVPNKQNGDGYKTLLSMENGEALYGAFHAMILHLSKQPKRDGWLTTDGTRDGGPLTAAALADHIKFSTKTVQSMLTAVTKDIGWLIDHSLKNKVESIAYPGKRVDIQFVAMAQKFHKAQAKNHPNQAEFQKENLPGTTLRGARCLEEIHINHKWEIKQIEALLEWVLSNSFWLYQIRSLGSILNVSRRNGSLKFENALAEMQAEGQSKLLNGEQLEQDMFKRGLGTEDYTQVTDPDTGEILWRLKN